MIRDILDVEKSRKFTGDFTTRLDEAAMTRALQVYASSPSLLSLLVSDDALDRAERDLHMSKEQLEAERACLTEGLISLQKYPFAVTARVHRELYGKKFLVRRNRGSKKKVLSERHYCFSNYF